ncbi:MAG: hypothetical protein WAL79_11530 [Nitrososphaeraceae archaeon]
MCDPLVNSDTSTFNCISTITMKNSSAIDVSINIKLMDDSAVCIWFDPKGRGAFRKQCNLWYPASDLCEEVKIL